MKMVVRTLLAATAISLCAASVAGGFVWGRSSTLRAIHPAPASAPRPSAGAPLQERSFAAILLPPQLANLSSRSEGKIVAVPARVGARVKKGDLLARFDAREREHALAMAQASLRAAQGTAATAGAALATARGRATRREGSVEIGGKSVALVSGEQAREAELDVIANGGRAMTASAQVAEQKARVAQLKLALEETELRAPFDGVVTAVYVEPDMVARAGQSAVRVVGEGQGLRVRFAVPERDHAILADLHQVRVEVDGTEPLEATIDRIAPEVEPSSRSYFCEGMVTLGGRDATTLAGRNGRVVIVSERTKLAANSSGHH